MGECGLNWQIGEWWIGRLSDLTNYLQSPQAPFQQSSNLPICQSASGVIWPALTASPSRRRPRGSRRFRARRSSRSPKSLRFSVSSASNTNFSLPHGSCARAEEARGQRHLSASRRESSGRPRRRTRRLPRGVTDVLLNVSVGILLDVEEVGAAEVLVALGFGGVDARRLNRDLDARALRARLSNSMVPAKSVKRPRTLLSRWRT